MAFGPNIPLWLSIRRAHRLLPVFSHSQPHTLSTHISNEQLPFEEHVLTKKECGIYDALLCQLVSESVEMLHKHQLPDDIYACVLKYYSSNCFCVWVVFCSGTVLQIYLFNWFQNTVHSYSSLFSMCIHVALAHSPFSFFSNGCHRKDTTNKLEALVRWPSDPLHCCHNILVVV